LFFKGNRARELRSSPWEKLATLVKKRGTGQETPQKKKEKKSGIAVL